MNLAFTLILVIAVIPSNTGAAAGVQASVEKTVGNSPENTNFLTGLSGIQEWASRLETALRNQGTKIDQSKAKDELLPRVIAIQKSLSDLEDINRRVVEDAGSRIEDLKREQIGQDLIVLKKKIKEIQSSFTDLREGVQAISLPEMTEIERLGEGQFRSRAVEVDRSLNKLGYGAGGAYTNIENLKIDYADLKASSDRITTLLHQAQDSFGRLHTYLAN